jgi:predicted dehydrogenase
MKPLRYVILGAGGISQHHVNEYAKQPDVNVVGFLDIDSDTLKRWKARFPHAEVATDVRSLLAKTRPDLASVCTPNHVHCSLTLAALAAGCHVLCEKPMAMTLAEAESMERARRKAGRLGAINFSYRNVAAFRFAREIIRSGELGRLQRMNVRYLQSFLGSGTEYVWRNDIKRAGFGALGDLGVHMLDGIAFITELDPRRIVANKQTLIAPRRDPASGKPRKVTTDTNANWLVEYEGGAIGTFETSQVVPCYGNFFNIEISGDKGLLRVSSEDNDNITLVGGPTLCRYGTWARENFPKVPLPTAFTEKQPKSTMESFVKAIRGEKVEYAAFADGVRSQRCLAAIMESIRAGAWAKV